MSWDAYVHNLMAGGECQDAAIVGYPENKTVWASLSGGAFTGITADEIDVLAGKDRERFFTNGLSLASKKCSVIRDGLHVDGDHTMDIRTKSTGGEPTYNIAVGKSLKTLVIVMGKEGIHGGKLNLKAFSTADHLRKVNY